MSEEAPLPPASDEGAGDRMDTGEEGPVAEDRDEQTDDGQNPAEEIDLKKMADDYARYLIVNSKQDQTALDDRIDGVYTRVDEFKQQLYFLHQNISSCSSKMQELYENSEQLSALFTKIDQMEAFLNLVGRSVDQLEDSVSQAEKDLEPSKLRKVFSSLPGLGKKSTPKHEATTNWQPPKVFRSRDYFSPGSAASTTSPSPSLASSSTSSFSGQQEEQIAMQQSPSGHGITGQQKTKETASS